MTIAIVTIDYSQLAIWIGPWGRNLVCLVLSWMIWVKWLITPKSLELLEKPKSDNPVTQGLYWFLKWIDRFRKGSDKNKFIASPAVNKKWWNIRNTGEIHMTYEYQYQYENGICIYILFKIYCNWECDKTWYWSDNGDSIGPIGTSDIKLAAATVQLAASEYNILIYVICQMSYVNVMNPCKDLPYLLVVGNSKHIL